MKYVYEKECKISYNNYLDTIASNIKNDPNSFWKFVNHKQKTNIFPSRMAWNGESADDLSNIAELFAKFFETVYSSKVYNSDNYPYLTKHFDIDMPCLSEEIVFQYMMKLKPTMNSGPDGIPKEFGDILAYPLYIFFQNSFKLGFFPSSWKESFIIPLHKSGSRSEISNYRGFTKLCAILKLFEQIVTFETRKIISPLQPGFLPKLSTTTNLLAFTNYVLNQFHNGRQTDVIYTDFSKAFDRVNHKLLSIKLRNFGCHTTLLNWIGSYHSGRTQKVMLSLEIFFLVREYLKELILGHCFSFYL